MNGRRTAPPLVTVLAVLLYIGGALLVASALLGLGVHLLVSLGQLVYGALYLGLARALQLGRYWARIVLFVLCALGLVLAAGWVVAGNVRGGITQALWPVVYLVLLVQPSVRAWYTEPRVSG
ncbi:hypothetical protein [Dactylosporangium sp. CS-033363]|uniref:hypothetical protein n=1 Tax=Dactylosporangium sp. CS-033363 TaxID=3239935 RepID=UPI003D8B9482